MFNIKDSFLCPFCSNNFVLTGASFIKRTMSFRYSENNKSPNTTDKSSPYYVDDQISCYFFQCPKCKKTTIKIFGDGNQFKDRNVNFNPTSLAIQFPEYIPEVIRKDYEEACSILELSPKASATLSRRCLQGIIRDFWNIKDKKNLYEEILAIEDSVDPQVNKVLNAIRQLGNISAHPEPDINLIVDIEPEEAEKMIQFIEYLLENWYIKRYETNKLLDEISNINESKHDQRKSKY